MASDQAGAYHSLIFTLHAQSTPGLACSGSSWEAAPSAPGVLAQGRESRFPAAQMHQGKVLSHPLIASNLVDSIMVISLRGVKYIPC